MTMYNLNNFHHRFTVGIIFTTWKVSLFNDMTFHSKHGKLDMVINEVVKLSLQQGFKFHGMEVS